MLELGGYFATFLMGITLGLIGGGGSILTVPILVYIFKIVPGIATGYSLFIVGLTALVGSIAFLRKGEVEFKLALRFAVPSVTAVYMTRTLLLPSLPENIFEAGALVLKKDILIMFVFALLMIVSSLSMMFLKVQEIESPTSMKSSFFITLLQGFAVGTVVGFVGAGGGFLIVPALVFVRKLKMQVAVGTSLMIISIQSLIGFVGDLRIHSSPDWFLLLMVALCATSGILLASALSPQVSEPKLKKSFGWFVLVLGTGILVEQLRQI